jgi:hypothetical protein
MNNYTNNGIAGLAAYGRGNDTELVHMTPGEVKGLQALAMAHGGSLTINPSTGLPEAGFLEDILPVVAAAGLTYLTAGAATPLLMSAGLGATSAGIVAGAGAGAAISGGFAAAQGKDVGQAALMGGLGGGISGGLGAYADANVFGVGATSLPDAGTQAVTSAVPSGITAGGDGISGGASMVPTPTPASGMPTGGDGISGGASMVPQNVPAAPGISLAQAQNVPMELTSSMVPQNVPVDPGISLAQSQKLTPSPTYYGELKPDQYIQKAGIQALPVASLLEDKQSVPGGQQEDEYTRRLKGYRLSPNYKPYEAPRPNPYYRPSYAAEGGVMSSFDDEAGSDTVGMAAGGMGRGIYTDDDPDTRYQDALTAAMTRLNKSGKTAGIKASPLPKTSIKELGDISGAYPRQAAGGGIMSDLGGYSDGGRMLKGPGDGMSDSIPGVIGGKQPARLADGEFVVPADVVSHLGNGSTDAGAKKLYNMMDNIRKARTGKKKQAPEVNVDKYLPGNKKASGGIAGYAEGGVARYNDGGPLATNIQNAYNAGYSGSQIGAALIAEGVTQAQAAAATGLSADVIAQVYAGGAAWNASGNPIGNPEGPARNTAATTAPVTPAPVTPVAAAPVNRDPNSIGPGGYTIPTFSDLAVATYLRDNNITSQAQIAQVSKIFNVSPQLIAEAQTLIRNNDPRIAIASQKYRDDIAANPAQVAQNERDVRARMAQLGLTGPIIPPIEPLKPIVPPPTTPNPTATTGPVAGSTVYRPGFVPRTTGLNVSNAAQNPYSDAGLESLYSQMMDQYNKPAGPMSDAAVKALAERAYSSGSGAEVGRALINAGIPVNQAITALKSYSGLTPEIVNQAYIGGQTLGTTPPPTLNTQYNYSDPGTFYRPPAPNNLVLTRPIVDAAFKAPAPAATPTAMALPAADAGGSRAGGLLSINRKKRRA